MASDSKFDSFRLRTLKAYELVTREVPCASFMYVYRSAGLDAGLNSIEPRLCFTGRSTIQV